MSAGAQTAGGSTGRDSGGQAPVAEKARDPSPLTFPRAIGFGISIGVNNFLDTLRLELTFLLFLWAWALYLVFSQFREVLVQFPIIRKTYPVEVALVDEWSGYVQEVIYTFLMTNVGIWATSVYDDASRPKPAIYFTVFIVGIGLFLYQYKYAAHSFFDASPFCVRRRAVLSG